MKLGSTTALLVCHSAPRTRSLLSRVPNKLPAGRLQQPPLGQIANQPQIRRQKIESRQLPQRGPSHVIEDPVLQRPPKLLHHKKLKIDGSPIAILMPHPRHPPPNDRLNPQLLVQLSRQRLFRRLARLNLAPRKLPLQAHRLIRLSLANQNLDPRRHRTSLSLSQN